MTPDSAERILVVDDEARQMRALCDTLQVLGYQARGYSSAKKALEEFTAGEFALVFTDLKMPEMDGITLLETAWRRDPDLAGVIMTGFGTVDIAVKAMRMGALDFLEKPFNINVLAAVTSRSLEVRRLRLENAQLTARQREYTIELEIANRDLESFSSSVSHDLRGPLRRINAFTTLFIERYGHSLSDEGRRLLNHVTAGATHLDRLVADLLLFCRSSRAPLHKTRVDCQQLVRQVAADLEAVDGARDVNWVIGELPVCEADETLLHQVLENLLSNAFKFTKHRHPAVIEIGMLRSPSECVVFVRDNGAGFDMRHASKLFGMFSRLHSQDQFDGTGVGLSIVRRIVERHGGRIWADASLDAGATFFFTLAPALEENAQDGGQAVVAPPS